MVVADHRVVELIQFTAAVSSSSYKGAESDRVARQLQGLLTTTDGSSGSVNAAAATATATTSSISSSNSNLPKDVRKACVSALILMRNKGAVAPLDLLPLFFNLMVVTADKALRELLYRHMVNDIRNINKKGKRDDKVNRSVQTFLHKTVQSCNDAGAAAASSSNNNHRTRKWPPNEPSTWCANCTGAASGRTNAPWPFWPRRCSRPFSPWRPAPCASF